MHRGAYAGLPSLSRGFLLTLLTLLAGACLNVQAARSALAHAVHCADGRISMHGCDSDLEITATVSAVPDPDVPGGFALLGSVVAPGERRELRWHSGQTFAGRRLETPILVVHGAQPGPVLCLTAAIHGDELNGIEIVRRIIGAVVPSELKGTLVGAPIVNLLGFSRGSRYLPDRRDLNRSFPGNSKGSSAARIAHSFFEGMVRQCHWLVDLHTGSFHRSNLPQLRANLKNPQVLAFTAHFGATAVLHSAGSPGMLRYAAETAGIPAVTFELGEPGSLQLEHVTYGVKALETLLSKLEMLERFRLWSEPQPIYYASRWIRANHGGILINKTRLGERVKIGAVLGSVVNPLSNEEKSIISPAEGRILGMAVSQFVMPGFAAYHIGFATPPPSDVDAGSKTINLGPQTDVNASNATEATAPDVYEDDLLLEDG